VPSALRRPTRHLRRGAPLQRRTRRSRGAGPALPPIRRNPRGVRLTFEAPSKRRTGVSGSPIPLRPFAGPWGLPPPRRPRPIARPTRLASLAFASPPRLSLEAACRASSLRAPRDAPLLGFPALQHMPDPRVHLRGKLRPPRYVPASGFRPSRRLPPREPSRPCFMPERSWASPFRGFLLRDRRCLSRGPSPPRRWLPAGCTLRGGKERTESAARSASPSPGLPVPGVRMPRPAVRQSPESAPLLGFILPEACDPPAAPPRPGGHPPLGFRTTFELAPRGRPGPPGFSTTSGLARLREPSSLSEVLSPL
jgi:hypothetical protein